MDLDNFIIGKTKERRGDGRFGKKSNSCLTNIERKRYKKTTTTSQTYRIGKVAKKQQLLISRGPFDHHMSYLICLS